jgi:hypothetical protein
MSQAEFMTEVVNAMDTTIGTTIISCPMPVQMVDYQGDAFLCAFPLQFPYGIGLPPDQNGNCRDGKEVSMSQLAYLQHLQHLSVHSFHGDFILVLHNTIQ